jgi:hypothetical protein
VISRHILPGISHPGVKIGEIPVMRLAVKEVTVKPKVSPASVVEKSWIEGGTLFPFT